MEQFNKVGGVIESEQFMRFANFEDFGFCLLASKSISIFMNFMEKLNMTFITVVNVTQVNFWYQEYFHGVNLSSLRDSAMCEYFRQPIVS